MPVAEYGYADVTRFLEEARKIMYKGDQPIYDGNATYDKIRDAIKDTNDLDQWIRIQLVLIMKKVNTLEIIKIHLHL